MRSIALAFQFLTVLPVPGTPESEPPRSTFGWAAGLFPLVGLALGLLALLIDSAVRLWWPGNVAAAATLAALVFLTGALHLDGFLDTCDGLFLWQAERRLDAMRDSRVGGFAVAGGLALYGLKLSALAGVDGPLRVAPLVLAPVMGRLALTLALVRFPYIRPAGTGAAFKEATGYGHLALALVTAAAAAFWFLEAGVVALTVTVLLTLGLGRLLVARLGGLTGDTYGFLCECVETATLLATTALPLLSLTVR